ncbi:MAG: cytochrome b/b6 domain-containing protein, partial [Deltaproteobacteria bacterium]|nr:cytochrome b/b6 domain-containing protein [Deltaproteobacteria bacterium]
GLLGQLVLGHAWASAPSEECIACHGRKDLRARSGKSRFIDPKRFAKSAHAKHGIGCTSCHPGITLSQEKKRVPHNLGIQPKCAECHEKVNREYSKSVHAQISKKMCYACHNPHYSTSYREMSARDRQNICLQCHNALQTHVWLPQKGLHFDYLECTSCHALQAQIGIVFFIVDRDQDPDVRLLDYSRLEPFVEPGKGGLSDAIDLDRSGSVSDSELQLFMKKLREGGIPGAGIDLRILVMNPSHDFTNRGEQARDCTLCHSREARFYSKHVLELPDKDGGFRTIPVEKGILARSGQEPFGDDLYLLGEYKIRKEELQELIGYLKRFGFKWLDVAGALIILMSSTGVFLHASLLFATRKMRKNPESSNGIEAFPVPVRAWHWVHGLCFVLLILTGTQLRLPDTAPIFATFLNAVNLHNLAGVILILNYAFWIAYHVWKRTLRARYIVPSPQPVKDFVEAIHFYAYQMFVGEERRNGSIGPTDLDPVERFFFFVLMLILLPIQMLTGILLYDVHKMMPVIRMLGGLRVVDAIHVIGAYLLVSSLVIHVYLHTLKRYSRQAGRMSVSASE